jgi:hypothetical protein
MTAEASGAGRTSATQLGAWRDSRALQRVRGAPARRIELEGGWHGVVVHHKLRLRQRGRA